MARLLAALMVAALACSSPAGTRAAPEPDRAKQPSETERSRKAKDFGHIVRQRDAQIERRAEVQRIINFADAAILRINRFFGDLPDGDPVGDLARRIQTELSRPERAEAAPPDPGDRRRDPRGPPAEQLSAAVPDPTLLRANPPRGTPLPESLRSAVAAFQTREHGPVMADLRSSVSELRQNLSQKHLYWAVDFENFMIDWDRQLRRASGAGAVEALRRLQDVADGAAGADAGEAGAADDRNARPLVQRHRDALQAAADMLKDRPTYLQVQQKILADAGGFAAQIKKVGADYDRAIEDVDAAVVNSADDIFGANINSEVFKWLLMAFAAIFVMIMLAPKLYAGASVAENILKAEFLLQFSTVFILTAAIILLGIGGFIQSDQLPVLLAGISGYVLGQLGKPGADLPKTALVQKDAASQSKPNPENDNQTPERKTGSEG